MDESPSPEEVLKDDPRLLDAKWKRRPEKRHYLLLIILVAFSALYWFLKREPQETAAVLVQHIYNLGH